MRGVKGSVFSKKERSIYYISNLGIDKVSIIDGYSYSIIKEIEVGFRPQSIIVDEKNNVYIASGRNGRVTLINDLYDANKTWYMPNNGNIKVDSIAQKIYVCDTEEVCIYSLVTGEKLACLTGFIAADSLELDKDKQRLFVLDVFENEIKVYDTLSFQLVKVYKDVGIAPCYILIGENERYIYIANKGINRGNSRGNISILDIESGDISYIKLKNGSVIVALEQSGNFLYAANSGLHRIEVIDILKRRSIATIKTTLTELQRLRVSSDKNILFATSRSIDGKGVLDRISTANNSILDTFNFPQSNTIPYDIGVVTQNKFQANEEFYIFNNLKNIRKEKDGTNILSKKVISTYEEKINFSHVTIKIPSKDEEVINIEEIIFQKCKVIKERKNINNQERDLRLQYDFYIPYYVEYTSGKEQKCVVEGNIKGTEKATLYMPTCLEQDRVEFAIDSFAKLASAPVVINKSLVFDVNVLISIKVIADEIVFIPLCKNCESCREEEKNEC